jgi:hypothetical protein
MSLSLSMRLLYDGDPVSLSTLYDIDNRVTRYVIDQRVMG